MTELNLKMVMKRPLLTLVKPQFCTFIAQVSWETDFELFSQKTELQVSMTVLVE